LNSIDVLDCLAQLFFESGTPEHIRSDNGSEFVVVVVKEWLAAAKVKTLNIEPG